jgi:hypothetical protein
MYQEKSGNPGDKLDIYVGVSLRNKNGFLVEQNFYYFFVASLFRETAVDFFALNSFTVLLRRPWRNFGRKIILNKLVKHEFSIYLYQCTYIHSFTALARKI